MDFFEFFVEAEEAGKRIDVYLSEKIENCSRSYIQKLINEKRIQVNQKATRSNYKLKHKDLLYVEIPEAEPIEIQAEDIPLDIVYEDEDVIVINKAQGMVVHPAAGHYSGTLVNALLFHCRDGLSGINGSLRPGIVHRLDKDTSGILIAAKNDRAHQELTIQLKERAIVRKYHAIVYNNLIEDYGTINAPIGRDPKDRKKMAVTVKNSKEAITHFRVLERFGDFTYIEARLETGRTHQIRVHMKHIGHPVLGDDTYGPKKQPFKLNGQMLHARFLGFYHPSTREYMEFEAPLPDYFNELLNLLRNREKKL